MIKWILFVIIFLLGEFATAQPHHDNIWMAADGNDALTINFSTGVPVVEPLDIPYSMEGGSASICDEAGELLFYTNGCHVFNQNHQVMENGIGLNPGEIYEDYCSLFSQVSSGYPIAPQSVTIIPWPGRIAEYLIFHISIVFGENPISSSLPEAFHLYYTSVDMDGGSNEGQVVEKNVLIDAQLREPKLQLVKHANGVDWWLLSPIADSDTMQYYLVDSSGIHFSGQESIGLVDQRRGRGGDQYVFAPQGNKMLRFISSQGLDLFDFDRTTGRLSNFQHFDFPQGESGELAFNGVGISPSGQYAYVSDYIDIYQYDLWADSIENTQYRVATLGNPDSLWIPPSAQLFQLGPDCKLYCFTVSGSAHHVIHAPDEPGDLCDFEQGGLPLPFPVFRDQPTFPNYRLGPLGNEGSPCSGPIVSTVAPSALAPAEVVVYPNPAHTVVQYVSPKEGVVAATLYDTYGRVAAQVSTSVYFGETGNIPVAGLPRGYYVLRVRLGNGRHVSKGLILE